jgi:hypothetical protein
MTLQEIENKLPNGLHDAQLLRLDLDLARSTLILEVEVDSSIPEEDKEEGDPTPAKITVTGLCYLKLDPPDVLNPYAIGTATLIDTGDDPVQKGLVDAEVAKKLPKGSFLHWIYLNGWNAIMVVGGREAHLELKQGTAA